jgi:hypothetical protein
VLQWLDHWRGKGGVGLIGGGFTPAPAWQTALDFAGIKSPLAIEKIDSKFSFADGAVTTEVMDFTRKASKWSLSGSATLDGKIDYRFDLRGLLRGHKDGDAVLRYLGDKPLEARMGGTLDAPKLHAPSFQTLVKEALRSAAKGALEKILDPEKAKEEGGLKRLKDLLKRK